MSLCNYVLLQNYQKGKIVRTLSLVHKLTILVLLLFGHKSPLDNDLLYIKDQKLLFIQPRSHRMFKKVWFVAS